MSPLKVVAALVFCSILFWVCFRLTRVAVDLGIAAGREAERQRDADPDAS